VAPGEGIYDSPVSTQEGFKLTGWLVEGEVVIFPFYPTQDTTLVAVWEVTPIYYSVSFVTGQGTALEPVEVLKGEYLVEIETSVYEHHRLDYWITLGGERVELPYQVWENTILVAVWQDQYYTVEFNANGGEAVLSQTVKSGLGIEQAPGTSSSGSYFLGWFNEEELVVFPFYPINDTVLIAHWVSDHYDNFTSAIYSMYLGWNFTMNHLHYLGATISQDYAYFADAYSQVVTVKINREGQSTNPLDGINGQQILNVQGDFGYEQGVYLILNPVFLIQGIEEWSPTLTVVGNLAGYLQRLGGQQSYPISPSNAERRYLDCKIIQVTGVIHSGAGEYETFFSMENYSGGSSLNQTNEYQGNVLLLDTATDLSSLASLDGQTVTLILILSGYDADYNVYVASYWPGL
jgi:hypothetical protein